MQDLLELLQQKEQELERIPKELEAVRITTSLLSSPVPAIVELQQQKERDVKRLQKEVEALRLTASLLAERAGAVQLEVAAGAARSRTQAPVSQGQQAAHTSWAVAMETRAAVNASPPPPTRPKRWP